MAWCMPGCFGFLWVFFFFQAEDGIRDYKVTGVQTCALPICLLGGTVAAPVGQLLDALTNPTDGLLSTVTGALENLTNVEGGPLGVLTELVNGLTQVDGEGLAPVIGTRSEERRVGKECRSRWS